MKVGWEGSGRDSVEVDGRRAGENFRRGSENSNLGTKNSPLKRTTVGSISPLSLDKGVREKIKSSLFSSQETAAEMMEEIIRLSSY